METDAIASFAIAVVDSPVLQSNALFSSNEILPANVIFSITISAIGNSIPCSITSVSPSYVALYCILSKTLPNGLILNSATRVVSGVPSWSMNIRLLWKPEMFSYSSPLLLLSTQSLPAGKEQIKLPPIIIVYSVTSGSLSAGLILSAATGVVSRILQLHYYIQINYCGSCCYCFESHFLLSGNEGACKTHPVQFRMRDCSGWFSHSNSQRRSDPVFCPRYASEESSTPLGYW